MIMGKKNIIITENQLTDLIGKYFPSDTSVGKFVNFLKDIDIPFVSKPKSTATEPPTVAKTKKKVSSVKIKSFDEPEAQLLPDLNSYKKLLEKLDAPITDENLKFMYAWRQGEGGGGRHNPFNTTLKTKNSTFFNYLNPQKTVGVQNYPSTQEGLEATYKTLQSKRYKCIVDGLQKNIGAYRIASECKNALKTWGTGDLVARIVDKYEDGAPIQVKSFA